MIIPAKFNLLFEEGATAPLLPDSGHMPCRSQVTERSSEAAFKTETTRPETESLYMKQPRNEFCQMNLVALYP